MVCVGRAVQQLGGKQLVMTHLSHEDPDVHYETLLAVGGRAVWSVFTGWCSS